MAEAVYLTIFIIFSINSLVEDVYNCRIRIHEIALGVIIVLTTKVLLGDANWIDTAAGGVVGALAFLLVRRFSKDRLGGGDVWFSAFIGCAFGFWTWDIGLLIAAFLGVLWTGILRLSKRRKSIRDIRIPFAPFMFAGAVVVVVFWGSSSW